MPPDVAELRRWIEKADHDRRTADAALSLNPPVTDTAGFHAQQAAEKLLKAFLFYAGAPLEKTHDLRLLVLNCIQHDPSYQSFVTRLVPLTAFAVRFRYPGPDDPTVQQVRSALEVVDDLRKFTLSRFPPGTI